MKPFRLGSEPGPSASSTEKRNVHEASSIGLPNQSVTIPPNCRAICNAMGNFVNCHVLNKRFRYDPGLNLALLGYAI